MLERLFKGLIAEVADSLARVAPGRCPLAPGVPVGALGFADVLDGQAPSADLVVTLESLVPGELHEAAVVEAIAAWERVASMAMARQGELIVDLTRRRKSSRAEEFVADEVSARLRTTRSAAQDKVALATCLGLLPALHDALAAGVIDVRKATALVDGTAHLGLDVAREVIRDVLPQVPDLTVPQVKARLRKLDLVRDPAAAEKRCARAKDERKVMLTPAPDAMAWITAFLPADDAMRAYTALTALAMAADPQDPRPIDARRADALVDVLGGILDSGVGPDGPLPTAHRRHPHLQVTAAATTLLGLDEGPGELDGYGPIPASMVRKIAADATWRRIFTDPATGEFAGIGPRGYRPAAFLADTVIARDVTCTFPGCRMPAWRCELDHRVAFHD
ncbi:DUF222 domain-containing protein, partial [Pengzhenrongella sp.]|uniref:DUF222 domain-containing protein n=1 Tax=Pengzhenrongella sp. TaxID=2888820 RepID=UPI002F95C13E